MHNFPIKVDDKEYWISRSVAVVGVMFYVNLTQEPMVLLVKRGLGCPDNIGKWCCPCGYLDYNETTKQAVIREIYEETGLEIPAYDLELVGIEDSPTGRQNVTIRYMGYTCDPVQLLPNKEHCEPNEVDEVGWYPVSQLDQFDLAFGHKELIEQFLHEYRHIRRQF